MDMDDFDYRRADSLKPGEVFQVDWEGEKRWVALGELRAEGPLYGTGPFIYWWSGHFVSEPSPDTFGRDTLEAGDRVRVLKARSTEREERGAEHE